MTGGYPQAFILYQSKPQSIPFHKQVQKQPTAFSKGRLLRLLRHFSQSFYNSRTLPPLNRYKVRDPPPLPPLLLTTLSSTDIKYRLTSSSMRRFMRFLRSSCSSLSCWGWSPLFNRWARYRVEIRVCPSSLYRLAAY